MSESEENQTSAPGVSRAEPAHHLTGSHAPLPENPPPPTVWPFVTAVGLATCFWGATLNLFVECFGIGVFLVGMAGLVGDWVREHRNQST
jgi:hypothetical protein